MAYILIEGYLCERCDYRWTSHNGTGFREPKDPVNCPKCKTPYWNKPRRNNLPTERYAQKWTERSPSVEPAA